MKVLTTKEYKAIERKISLMSNGVPRYIRCYDNLGKSFDRYTVVFTGRYRRYKTVADEKSRPTFFVYISMSANPFHPQGFGQHGESNHMPIDKPTYSQLGKKIKFNDLPIDCRKLVVSNYVDIWEIK